MPQDWSDLVELTPDTVQKIVESKPGVYRMSSKRNDGKYYVFYVGQATDVRARLLQHLGDNEENECIRSERVKDCVFRFTYVDSQRERDSVESQTIQEYNPNCNTKKP